MIIFDQKKALQTIMAKRNPKDGTETSAPMKSQVSMDEDGEVDGRHSAAQDILAAMHEKDPQKLMEAMAAFHDLHAMRAEEPSETEEA